jgi:dual oxidase
LIPPMLKICRTFLYGSRPGQEEQVTQKLGQPMSYRDYVALLPGWSGITALGLFYVLALTSMPFIRSRSYELFQFGHLLMFPIIGLLFAHGTRHLLQFYMLGYWLAIPTILVLVERVTRLINGFIKIKARLEILDGDTVGITATIPNHRYWSYKAGQYIFLQVRSLSLLQWHPFTISICIGNEFQVHIKTDGDWTSKLRALCKDGQPTIIDIGIDGPFGAPAQRFYDFDHSIILGSGIGVTPFSGILADLQARENRLEANQATGAASSKSIKILENQLNRLKYRRVDFHWIVKDKNYLLWFSDLLNNISRSSMAHSNDEKSHLDVNIVTHVTQKRKNISTHIYRYLLECHRTEKHPASALTGLINTTHFGRPNLAKIMDDHYEMMLRYCRCTIEKGGLDEIKRRKVGVFFCGAPPIGYELADRCSILNLRGREDKSLVEYYFMMEVFG